MDEFHIRLAEAKTDNRVLNDLVSEYQPFIRKEVSHGTYAGLDFDDRLSIGMLVFVNCVRQYEPGRGNFFSYTAVAIRNRLADELRRQARHRSRTVSLDAEKDENLTTGPEEAASVLAYSREQERWALAEEIERFSQELRRFGVQLDDLDRLSPPHKSTRRQCAQLAGLLMADGEMRANFLRTGRLPASRLSAAAGVSYKKLDRHRPYIIALALVFSGDFQCMQTLIPHYEEVE